MMCSHPYFPVSLFFSSPFWSLSRFHFKMFFHIYLHEEGSIVSGRRAADRQTDKQGNSKGTIVVDLFRGIFLSTKYRAKKIIITGVQLRNCTWQRGRQSGVSEEEENSRKVWALCDGDQGRWGGVSGCRVRSLSVLFEKKLSSGRKDLWKIICMPSFKVLILISYWY